MRKPAIVSRTEIRARQKRFKILARLLSAIDPPVRILDVGGEFDFWKIVDYGQLGPIRVTLLNLFPQENLPVNFCSRVGDARCLRDYGPHDFDVVMSNSVIGHVGSFEDQKRMAEEIKRVGRRYFLQTPNRYFPIDWRTMVPLFHFLPLQWQAQLLYHLPITRFGRLKSYSGALQWATSARDLTRRELRILFPEATIVSERVLGLTKSFMVFTGFCASPVRQIENEGRATGNRYVTCC